MLNKHTVNSILAVNESGTQDGSEDDGEHGAGRLLFKTLINNDEKNILLVILRWYGDTLTRLQ